MLNPALVNAWISDQPEEFLYELYGDQLRRDGYGRWRVETPHALRCGLQCGAFPPASHATCCSSQAGMKPRKLGGALSFGRTAT